VTASPSRVAALYVASRGVYASPPLARAGCDPWGLDGGRDARGYAGPWPVVAHPPCERWGAYAAGGPSARTPRTPGDDGGCFAAALASACAWGGVVEHPRRSAAWDAHGLDAPALGGPWVRLACGGWALTLAQGPWGLAAVKPTTLVAWRSPSAGPGPGGASTPPPALAALVSPPPPWAVPEARGIEAMARADRAATPPALALALVRLAACLGGGPPPAGAPRPWPEARAWEWGR